MNLCTLSRRPRAEQRSKERGRDDRPFSMVHPRPQQHNTQVQAFKGLKGNRNTFACRNSFDSDDPELEEIEFNKSGPEFHSFSEDIDEPIYSEPEFKCELQRGGGDEGVARFPAQFDFHIYDLLSVRAGSYQCRGRDRSSDSDYRGWGEPYRVLQGSPGGPEGWGEPYREGWGCREELAGRPSNQSSDSDYASYDASLHNQAGHRGRTGLASRVTTRVV